MVRKTTRAYATAIAVVAAALLVAPRAEADVWNERTKLTITESVMIPGATLQPGTYTFVLANHLGQRHIVRVEKETGETVATVQAVPTRRLEPADDTILKFNPTEKDMPALKAWFYPGSVTGHEFVYSDDEAKLIAERHKTLVLSTDVPGTDLSKGQLHVFNPEGMPTAYTPDPETAREWDAWQRDREENMPPAEPSASTTTSKKQQSEPDRPGGESGLAVESDTNGEGEPDARAPMMRSVGSGTRVELDELEENPTKFVGQRISVDGEVEEVYGPRLFTIDEPHWGDLDGEVLVYAPSAIAALVKDNDRVTVTGTMKVVTIAELEKEWGWFELDPDVEVEFNNRPLLIADSIIGGNNQVAMYLDLKGEPDKAADPSKPAAATDKPMTSGANTTVMDLGTIAHGTSDLVGRRVDLKNVRVLRPANEGGFFVDGPNAAVLVVPAHTLSVDVAPGEQVTVDGLVAETPRDMTDRLGAPSGWNDEIYILATSVSR